MEKTEKGVMVMKDGKAWGVAYADGKSTICEWMNPADKGVKIRDPDFFKKPTDFTYSDSPDLKELSGGKVVLVERKTTVTVLDG